jgi:hypothetical protein
LVTKSKDQASKECLVSRRHKRQRRSSAESYSKHSSNNNNNNNDNPSLNTAEEIMGAALPNLSQKENYRRQWRRH